MNEVARSSTTRFRREGNRWRKFVDIRRSACLLGLPFLFFIDAAQGRAAVLYLRYDGHYGLITPAG